VSKTRSLSREGGRTPKRETVGRLARRELESSRGRLGSTRGLNKVREGKKGSREWMCFSELNKSPSTTAKEFLVRTKVSKEGKTINWEEDIDRKTNKRGNKREA